MEKIKKEVDRRASKNRKIRYVVHEKLVSFMTPADNLSLQEGRESILRSLFGQQPLQVSEETNGKKKKKKHVEEEEDEVKLL